MSKRAGFFFGRLKLREKLLISLLAVSLIPFLGMALYQHQAQRKQLFDRGREELQRLVPMVKTLFDADLNSCVAIAWQISQDPFVAEAIRPRCGGEKGSPGRKSGQVPIIIFI